MRYKVNIPTNQIGDFKIVVSTKDTIGPTFEPLDEYTELLQKFDGVWENIMQDTPTEHKQCQEFISAAHGNVLVAGLGIGMVAQPLIDKPSVTSITFIEKYQEVIDMVWNHVPASNKLILIKADIHEWIPQQTYDVAWFDSWISNQDGHDILTYVDAMRNKYSGSVIAGYLWPNLVGWQLFAAFSRVH